jgi:protein-disulfide isomerase
MPPQQQQQNLAIPVAIVVAGIIVAGALFFAGKAVAPSNTATNTATTGDAFKVPPVAADDHILGNPGATVTIIEYTDIECPFCKQFHATMEEIMNVYGADGKVAWVLRNFPIVQLHSNAPKLAEAAECIAHELGNTAYWKFLTEVFTIAPSGSFFPLDRLTEVATKVGANADTFNQCVAADTYKDLIAKQFKDATATGGQGTPHSIIVTADGQAVAMEGAQPYATVKSVIDSVIGNQAQPSSP